MHDPAFPDLSRRTDLRLMPTVHHLENSRSHRVVWLLEELETDYDIEHYARDPETMLAPDELREVHPLGRSPVLTDGGRTVAESAVILEYLLDEYGEGDLRPPEESEAGRRYRYWMHYAEGSAMPDLVMRLVFTEMPEQAPWPANRAVGFVAEKIATNWVDPRLDRHLDFWTGELEDRAYFAGDRFTAADIQMSLPLAGALKARRHERSLPTLEALLDRLRGRAAFQRAVERTGDDEPLA